MDSHIDINDLGYMRRNDLRGFRYHFGMSKSNLNRVRKSNTFIMLDQKWNRDDQQIRSAIFVNQRFTLNNLMEMGFEIGMFPEAYDDRNAAGYGVYKVNNSGFYNLRMSTDSSRSLSAGVNVRRGGESAGGYNLGGGLHLTWRANNQMTLSANLGYLKRNGWLLHQGEGDFTTFDAKVWEPSINFDYFFNAKQQFRVSMQWVGIIAEEDEFFRTPDKPGELVERDPVAGSTTDDFTISNLNIQVRYRWELAPLSDLFLVYTRTANPDTPINRDFTGLFRDALSDPVGEQLVLKLRYRLGS